MFPHGFWPWAIFIAFVLIMLVFDLGVLNRKKHAPSLKESLGWSGFWIGLGLAFAVVLYLFGHELGLIAYEGGQKTSEAQTAITYLTAYLIEQSLSLDNVFVFLLIFQYFAIPRRFQHEVLFWGILGALVMRLSFIIAGIALLNYFSWVIFILGAILLYTGIRMFQAKGETIDPGKNPVMHWLQKRLPVTQDMGEGKFFLVKEGTRYATPLLVALIVIETSDVLFAVDSVPAVLGVTRDSFIAFSSNVFAILGLRALYFALAEVVKLFKDLHYGLSFIMVFVGTKLVGEGVLSYTPYHLPDWFHWVSLGVVLLSLAVTVLTSIFRHRYDPAGDQPETGDEGQAAGQDPANAGSSG